MEQAKSTDVPIKPFQGGKRLVPDHVLDWLEVEDKDDFEVGSQTGDLICVA
jgi:hypothetical protein